MKNIILLLTLFLSSSRIYSQDLKFELEPEVLVSNNNDGSLLRVEPSAAIYDSIVIVAWNDSYGGMKGHRIGVSIGWAISFDQGKLFKFGGYLPRSQRDSLQSGADSWLQTDAEGNFYLQMLRWQGEEREIVLYYMNHTNLGQWEKMTSPVNIRTTTYAGIDKPAMNVNKAGEVGIAYSQLTEPYQEILYVQSNDKGKNWFDPIRISDSENQHKAGVNIARNQNEIVVTWIEDAKEVWYNISRDGGTTFSNPTMLYELQNIVSPPKGYALGIGPAARIPNNPWITSDNSGNFYLTIAEGTENKGTKLFLFTKAKRSIQWSGPEIIGNSPDLAEKVFPSIAAINSKPAILYYDRRESPDTSLTDVYLSTLQSDNSYKDIKLNTIATDWLNAPGDKEHAMIQRNFGDYITLAVHKNILFATWTDAREGPSRIYSRVIKILD